MDATTLPDLDALVATARVLSAFSVMVVAGIMVHLWRRATIPVAAYGGVPLSPRRMKWIWTGVLLSGLGLGSSGDPLAVRTQTFEDREASDGQPRAGAEISRSLVLPLPFYRYDRRSVFRGGHLVERTVSEGLLIPFELMGALLAYWVLVVRWNPESRWARRILHGRRWRREGGGDAGSG